MPFICAKISEPLTEIQFEMIKSDLGKAISLLPGKSEAYLMVEVEDKCQLYFRVTVTRRPRCARSACSGKRRVTHAKR